MRALVTLSARFERGPDGRVYPQNPSLTYEIFFKRYLEVFEEILVVARVVRVKKPASIYPSDGAGVTFIDVPMFSGVLDLMKFLPRIRKILRQAISDAKAYFLRVPDFLGSLAYQEIRRLGLPFAVEVVGDPADSLQGGSVRHPLRPLIRHLAIRQLRAQCAAAAAAAYVTKHVLQERYPPGAHAYTTNYSTINLPESFFTDKPRQYTAPARRLVFVGTLEVFYKAPDVLLEALKILADRGIPMHLDVVGDGRCRPQLEALVNRLNLNQQIIFHGKVPHQEVSSILDGADLFVLPSRTEGLPRAMIEAMARALPCIGSTAGGIPELLPPEDMVPPGDALALAYKIMEVAQNPPRMTAMSARNLATAQEYRNEVLQGRRIQFYRHVRELAEKARKG
jgi:glycosyltransferase involved in cell wall biosynthesis